MKVQSPQLVSKWKIFNKGACEHGELNGDSENKLSFGQMLQLDSKKVFMGETKGAL
jgi:hypothetical protein